MRMLSYAIVSRSNWAFKMRKLPTMARLDRGGKREMYAVIETGGKQYRVQEGDVITVEKLKAEAGDKITFDRVLAVNDGKELKVGTPVVSGVSVSGTVVENGKGKKVIIFKYKAKKDYRKKQGHRQPYTMVKIDKLGGSAKAAPKAEAPAESKAAEKAADKSEEKPAKVSLKSMKKAELIDYAKQQGVDINEKATKDEIMAAIEAAAK